MSKGVRIVYTEYDHSLKEGEREKKKELNINKKRY